MPYFHCSERTNRESILTDGLRPPISISHGGPWFRGMLADMTGAEIDTWQVDVTGEILYPDEDDCSATRCYRLWKRIPPEKLQLVESGPAEVYV